MSVFSRFDRLLPPVARPRRVVASWVFIGGVIVVSALSHVHAVRPLIDTLCLYRGTDLTTVQAPRMLGGALLVRSWFDLVLGVLGLALALPALERRTGTWVASAIAVVAHVLASIGAGAVERLANDAVTLHEIDAGTSVVMVACATALGILTRWWVLVVVAIGLLADYFSDADLAASEHLVATAVGLFGGVLLRARCRASS